MTTNLTEVWISHVHSLGLYGKLMARWFCVVQMVNKTMHNYCDSKFRPFSIVSTNVKAWCTSEHSVHFSSVPWLNELSGGLEERFNRDPLPVFSAQGPCEQFWHGQGCPLFDVVHPAFSLPTRASPTLQGTMKNDFGEAVVAGDMPEPCKFPSLNSWQKMYLWTHKEVDLNPHPVVDLVLRVGHAEKLPHALGFKRLNPFFRVS